MISLEKPQRKWASSRLEGRSSWIFRVVAGALDLRRGLRDPLWWPQERPVPMRVARETLGIPLPSMPGPKTLCGVGAGTRGFLGSADMDPGVFLESPQGSQSSSKWWHARALSSRAVAAVSRFPSRGSRDLWLSFEAFPKGSPTCHRGVSRSLS